MSIIHQTTNSQGFSYSVEYAYHSKDLTFAQWTALFTLCLAPLIAHMLAGAPRPIILAPNQPRWHDQIVHYNPTSILWRYFAIADRRIRARNWNHVDMAACNALFWTAHGWDGSEEIMLASRHLWATTPSATIQRILSIDTLKTILVTLQGAQAIYSLIVDFSSALDTIFMPLAVLGLLRLPAALWLSNNHSFVGQDDLDEFSSPELVKQDSDDENCLIETWSAMVEGRCPSPDLQQHIDISGAFRKPIGGRGLAIRSLYIISLGGLLTLYLAAVFPYAFSYKGNYVVYSVTICLLSFFYGMFLVVSIVIYLTYFIVHRSSSSTTVIPCVKATWYKIYTCVLMATILVMIIIAGLQTRRTPCGVYTTFDSWIDDQLCPGWTTTA